jgi:hypothetical protein
MLLWPLHIHTNAKFSRPFSLGHFGERDAENSRKTRSGNSYLFAITATQEFTHQIFWTTCYFKGRTWVVKRKGLQKFSGRHFIKMRRLVALCAVLGTLFLSGVSVSADEKLGPLHTSLGNGIAGGYVTTSASGQVQPPTPHGFMEWLQTFFHRKFYW